MSNVPEDLRLAVGDVVLAATMVEYGLVQVIRRVSQRDWDWARETLAQPGGARRAFRTLIDEHPDADRDDMKDLFDQASELLDERNAIVHGYLMPVSNDGGDTFILNRYSAKRDKFTPIQVSDLQVTAEQLEQVEQALLIFRTTNYPPPPDAAKPWT